MKSLDEKTYLAQYRLREWRELREQIFKIDSYTCQRCFRAKTDGAILQVHHKNYFKGRKPWDYPLGMLETICKGCHAAEHGIIAPRVGWEFLGCDDLGGLDGHCDLCGTEIRHVYFVSHPNWHVLNVGTDCCDRLTESNLASEDERKRRNFNQRKKTFISSNKWYKTAYGLDARQDHGVLFLIESLGEKFKLIVNYVKGNKLFESKVDAKAAAFDFMNKDKSRFEKFIKNNPLTY
jgi:hypothetical protein